MYNLLPIEHMDTYMCTIARYEMLLYVSGFSLIIVRFVYLYIVAQKLMSITISYHCLKVSSFDFLKSQNC